MVGIEFEIVNVVGTISYPQELDLAELAETFASRKEVLSVTYAPTENHWLQTNFAPDGTYVAFYRSGSCSITGISSVKHFEDVVDQVNDLMSELLDLDVEPESKVSNLVATAELDINVPLEQLAVILGFESVEYEPEQFPALIYRDPDSNGVINVFPTGKFICTGLNDERQIADVIEGFNKKVSKK